MKLNVPIKANKKLTVINLFAGPGAGKSVLRADIFSRMKKQGFKVEEVTEFAKDLVWDQRDNMFIEQDYLLTEQYWRLRRLVLNNIRICVTDTSLLNGFVYAPKDYFQTMFPHVLAKYNSFTNINIFLRRGKFKYQQDGRNENLVQSVELDMNILDRSLIANNLPFYVLIAGNSKNPQKVIDIVNGNKTGLIIPDDKSRPDIILKSFGIRALKK